MREGGWRAGLPQLGTHRGVLPSRSLGNPAVGPHRAPARPLSVQLSLNAEVHHGPKKRTVRRAFLDAAHNIFHRTGSMCHALGPFIPRKFGSERR